MHPHQTPGDRLRWARAQLGISARQLGIAAGLKSASHVGLIESGARDNPSGETYAKLADTLGATLDWLQLGRGESPDVAAMRVAYDRASETAASAATGTEG